MGKHRGRDEDGGRQQHQQQHQQQHHQHQQQHHHQTQQQHQQQSFPRNVPQIQMTPSLVEVLDGSETFFHRGQQSNKMLLDNSRRMRLSHELQRRSFVTRLIEQGVDAADIPPVEVDVNSSEVTVTMQIHHDEYTELFQRRLPDNLSSIMRDTDTLIRFPDQDDETSFACQVSINGQMPNVEIARRRLRDLCHLSITFSFEENMHGFNSTQISDWIHKKHIENGFPFPRVIVRTIVPHNRKSQDSINVLGTFSLEEEVVATIRMITEHLFKPNVADKLEFFTELSVPISQLDMYVGGEQASQLLAVAKNTNASLHFLPNPHPKSRFHNFLITGKPEAIITAFKIMTALQPVQLSLNARNEETGFILGRGETWKYFNSNNAVHTSICPSALQPSTGLDSDPIIHFLCFTAQEHNMGSCYDELMNTLRRDSPLVNLIPRAQAPSYMEPIRPHIGDISKYLDIMNRNQPMYLSLGGDIDALVPSYSDVENGDCDSVQDLEILRRGNGDVAIPDGDTLSNMKQQQYRGFPNRDDRGGRRFGGSSRSSVDDRSESGSYTRSFSRNYSGSFRGNRNRQMSGGDRRGNYFGGRGRFDRGPPRDRDSNVKSELQLKPKTNDTNAPADRHYSNNGGKNYVFSAKEGGDHFQKRDGHRNYRGHNHPRHSGPNSPAYVNYYNNSNPNWRPSNDKIYLRNRTPDVSRGEQDMPSPNELNRRMNAMDLIKQASAEQPVFPEDHDSAGRATYAEILEGNMKRPYDSKATDSSQELDFGGRQKFAQYSYSATTALPPSNGGPSYPSYSPFASGVNYLDRRVDVDHVLFSLNCTKYIEIFRQNKINDLRTFSMLSESNLVEIGVSSELDRKTILSYAIRLRTSGPPPPATASRSGPSLCA